MIASGLVAVEANQSIQGCRAPEESSAVHAQIIDPADVCVVKVPAFLNLDRERRGEDLKGIGSGNLSLERRKKEEKENGGGRSSHDEFPRE